MRRIPVVGMFPGKRKKWTLLGDFLCEPGTVSHHAHATCGCVILLHSWHKWSLEALIRHVSTGPSGVDCLSTGSCLFSLQKYPNQRSNSYCHTGHTLSVSSTELGVCHCVLPDRMTSRREGGTAAVYIHLRVWGPAGGSCGIVLCLGLLFIPCETSSMISLLSSVSELQVYIWNIHMKLSGICQNGNHYRYAAVYYHFY